MGRKIIATCKIFVRRDQSDQEPAYRRLCNEFVEDRRAGLINIREHVQFYVVPPQLKGAITVLRSVEGNDTHHTLYGIMVTKDPGPPEYVNAPPETMDLIDDMPPSPVNDMDAPSIMSGSPSGLPIPSTSLPTVAAHVPPQPAVSYSAPPAVAVPQKPVVPVAPVPPVVQARPSIAPVLPPHSVLPPRPVVAPVMTAAPRPMMGFGGIPPRGPPASAMGRGVPVTAPRGPTPAGPAAQPVPQSFLNMDRQSQSAVIAKFATFCSENGVQAIQLLKERDSAMTLTPFLFEGQPGHDEFLAKLKSLLGFQG